MPPKSPNRRNSNAWEADDNDIDSDIEMSKDPSLELKSKIASKDIRDHMNIKHFEQLQGIFHAHVNPDGSTGFDLEMFLNVFREVLGGNLNDDQLSALFNKIDANSDGTVDWDEFSTYMMTISLEEPPNTQIIEEKNIRFAMTPSRDMIVFIDYLQRDRRYITVSREGVIILWSLDVKVQKIVRLRDFTPKMSWVSEATYLHDHHKIALLTDDRKICFLDIVAIKPRLVVTISQLEYNPLSISYSARYDDEIDLILVGDDGGYINVFKMKRKFLVDNSSDNETENYLTPNNLTKRDSFDKYSINMFTRKCHNEWVTQIRYYDEMNAFVTCASEYDSSICIGDLERKTIRQVHVPQGVRCFEFCKRPSFLVTGGRDKIIRLWNPYVLSKPAGSLYGHASSIMKIIINHDEGHIISLSEDKTIKIWNAHNLSCIATLFDRQAHWPDNVISSIYFDAVNRNLVNGSDRIEILPLFRKKRIVTRSHESAVVAAMFNESFHQVVSASQDGTVTIWDPTTGAKLFQYHNAHGGVELTSVCFDKIGRRLMTGSRNGIIKMWNYNNGQMLKIMTKHNQMEVTDITYIEMGTNKYIVGVGWDRLITIYTDDPDEFEAEPARILNGKGNSVYKGHEEDISTVVFHDPNWLAIGSVDGTISVWNLESSSIRFSMRDPFLEFRSQEEKAVEKLLFFKDKDGDKESSLGLISCHSDGCIRFWDLNIGSMKNEVNVQTSVDEGLTTMVLDSTGQLLVITGSKGHIRILDLEIAKNWRKDKNLKFKELWRAHVSAISSVSYLNNYEVIISASKDASVRVWTTEGIFIGAFGQDMEWDLKLPSTYKPLPADVDLENKIETQKNDIMASRKEDFKKTVLETWRSVPADNNSVEEVEKYTTVDFKENVRKLRVKALQNQCISKWKEFWVRRKEAEDWRIPKELVTVKRNNQFFSFTGGELKSRNNQKVMLSTPQSIFHMLVCHDLEDVAEIGNSLKNAQKASRKAKDMKKLY